MDPKTRDELRRREEEWRRRVLDPALEKRSERRAEFPRSGGEDLERLYTPLHREDRADPLEGVGYPGQYPFTRGVHPTMYRTRLWTMRQYAGFGTADETNRRFRFLLERGQTGLSVAFDLPTQMGYDSDHPLVEGEVGRAGVAIDTLEDLERLLDGIPLDRVSISMTINASAAILLGFLLALARRRGTDWSDLRGTLQNDVLKEYIARGTYIYPPGPSLRLVTDIIEFCSRHVPRWNPISVSGYHIREAGASAAQEIAFTLGNGRAYVQAAVDRGLDVDSFAGRLSFFFNAHNRFLEEVAKFRAARRLWASILRDEFGAKKDRSLLLRFHCQTAGSTLTMQQPENNVVRVTLQALAAVLGGCQSLHTNSRDEALGLPTEEAALIALRTQQILAHETGVADTVDPLGGSWALERLTDELEREAREILGRMEDRGGVLACVEDGWIQRQIQDVAYRTQLRLEQEEEVVVGVNRYDEEEGETDAIPVLRLDPELERDQTRRVAAFRADRDAARARAACESLESTAHAGDNVMEAVVEAADAGATLGEMAQALRHVFGSHGP